MDALGATSPLALLVAPPIGFKHFRSCIFTSLEIGVFISFTITYNANYNAAAPLSNILKFRRVPEYQTLKCASCGKWRCEFNTSAINLKFLGKFNNNTIQLP